MKSRSDKSACANIFLELPLPNMGIIVEWMQRHSIDHTLTFIYWLLISYVTYTCNYDTTAKAEFRSSRRRCFWKCCKFHRKTSVLESLFYKVASLQACNVIKKRLLHRCFLVKFETFWRATILKNIRERLLLCIDYFIIYWFWKFTTVPVFHFYK